MTLAGPVIGAVSAGTDGSVMMTVRRRRLRR